MTQPPASEAVLVSQVDRDARETIARVLAQRFIERGNARVTGSVHRSWEEMPGSYRNDFYADADAVLAASTPITSDAGDPDAATGCADDAMSGSADDWRAALRDRPTEGGVVERDVTHRDVWMLAEDALGLLRWHWRERETLTDTAYRTIVAAIGALRASLQAGEATPVAGQHHWSRQEIVKTIINAMVEAKGDVKAVPAGKAADHILAFLAPVLAKGEAAPVVEEHAIDRRHAAKIIHNFYMREIERLMHQAQHWHDEGKHPLAVHHRVFAADEFFQVACRFDPEKREKGWGDPFDDMEKALAAPKIGVGGKNASDGKYPPSPELHAYRNPCFVADAYRALSATPAKPDQTAQGDWVAVPREPTEAWAYAVATFRQGQREEPRCEAPSGYDIGVAKKIIIDALGGAAMLAAAPGPIAGEEW